MTAHELTHFINSLLTPLSEIILTNRGTIDKYMGDAIMAFWNAPLDDPEHVDHAITSALGMIERMKDLNREWRAEAEADVQAAMRQDPLHPSVLGALQRLSPVPAGR